MSKNQNGIAHLGIILAMIVLAVVGLVGRRVWSAGQNKASSDNFSQAVTDASKPQDSPVKFTENIFDLTDISHIGPLGELNGGYEEAQTITGVLLWIKPEALSGGKEIAIRAPTKMTLESYAFYRVGSEPSNWTLIFKHSGGGALKFDHISRASDKLIAATTSTPKSDSREESPKSKVSFEAGEIFAYTSGTSLAHNWNIYAYDANHKNRFINQARYESDQVGQRLINAVCPFGYYDEPKRAAFMALMGQTKAGQTSTCGEVSRDKKGTISGMWHLSADTGSGVKIAKDGIYESPLSIYKNAAGVISINQINGKRIDVEPGSKTHKDPAEVTTVHCYEGKDAHQKPAGYVFFKVVDDNQMSLAYSPSGSCPNSFPGQNAKTYYR